MRDKNPAIFKAGKRKEKMKLFRQLWIPFYHQKHSGRTGQD